MSFEPPAALPPSPTARPTRLTVFMVLLWVFEGLVLVVAAYSFLVLLAQLVMGPFDTLPPGHPGHGMASRVFWDSFPLLQLPVHLVQMGISGAALFLGIQSYRGVREGALRLRSLLLAAALFAVGKAAFVGFVQYRVLGLSKEYMGAMMSANSTPPPGFSQFMDVFMTTMIVVGIVFSVLVLIAKLVLYLLARRALNAPDVQAFLARSS